MSAGSGSCSDPQEPKHRESIPSRRTFNADAGRSKSSPTPDAGKSLYDEDDDDDDDTTNSCPRKPSASPFASGPQGLSCVSHCLALPCYVSQS